MYLVIFIEKNKIIWIFFDSLKFVVIIVSVYLGS